MSKKRVAILLVVVLLLVLYSADLIYENYYKIDYGTYHSIHLIASADSPDKKHAIGVTAYKEAFEADEVYLHVLLYDIKADGQQERGGKTIMWDKVQASDVEAPERTPGALPGAINYSVYAEWITPESILVNGRIVDINKGYDYRRH